jgi:hypothetical protein
MLVKVLRLLALALAAVYSAGVLHAHGPKVVEAGTLVFVPAIAALLIGSWWIARRRRA